MLIHSRVLEQASARCTVLPMRFGVVMAHVAEIRERLLEEHADDLARQLKDLHGKLEVRIRANYDEPTLLAEVLRADPDVAKLRQQIKGRPENATYYGRIRLGELVAEAVERIRERDSAEMVTTLAAAAIAVDEGGAAHERVVFNASFLVDRERVKEFDELLSDLAARHASRARFKYTGPLPPYSFVQLT
jgi:hypothetical protein